MFNVLRQMVGRLIPLRLKIFHRALYNYHYGSEPELRLLRHLCDLGKAAIDVGAHMGIYTFFLKAHSSACYAVELIPVLREILRQSFGNGVTIFPFAVSDQEGTETLRIPMISNNRDRGRATIETKNTLDSHPHQDIEIEKKKLDGLDFSPIGIIKIDVEGHELAVLKGARGLLERDHPVLIVETEERHCAGAVKAVHCFLVDFGYHCFFLLDDHLHPFSEFDPARHQNPEHVSDLGKVKGQVYINNLIFLTNPNDFPGLRKYGVGI
jgi:FkbM family methyltransferase